jgi:hypothetical protein
LHIECRVPRQQRFDDLALTILGGHEKGGWTTFDLHIYRRALCQQRVNDRAMTIP